MAFFRRQQKSVQTIATTVTAVVAAPAEVVPDGTENDLAKRTLDLLELDLVAMVRQVERAAASVADGAASTAETLATIRERTAALTGRTGEASQTATTFSQASEAFARSAADIGSQGEERGRPRRPGEWCGRCRE